MSANSFIWKGREADDFVRARIRRAIAQSELSFARVQGMKIAAQEQPPSAAVGGFPYPARTCAQWIHVEDRGRCEIKRRGQRK